MQKKCKTCKHWDYGECEHPKMDVTTYGKKKGVWLNDGGADVGRNVEEMEMIIDKVRDALWLQTHRNFCCINWEEMCTKSSSEEETAENI